MKQNFHVTWHSMPQHEEDSGVVETFLKPTKLVSKGIEQDVHDHIMVAEDIKGIHSKKA